MGKWRCLEELVQYGAVLSNSWHKWENVFGRGDNTNQLLVVFTIIVAPPLSVASLKCVCLCACVCTELMVSGRSLLLFPCFFFLSAYLLVFSPPS